MSTRTDAYIQATLDLIYRNTTFAGIGDVTGLVGSTTEGSLYIALLTASDEVAYIGYARVAVARSAAGWSRTGNVTSNVSDLNFTIVPAGATPQTATRAAIYTVASGGTQLHVADLETEVPVQAGVQPVISAGALTITGS